jgi:PLP dependent protein
VNADFASFPGRLHEIRLRIAAAAERSGRAPSAIALIGVAKTVDAETVQAAVAAGLDDVAENRVQEAERKIPVVTGNARWHLVGHLQRNKVARAVALFDRLHAIDDVELASAVARHAVAAGRVMRALVQVNVTGEGRKHGVAIDAADELVEKAAGLAGLAIDGLMSIGPLAGGMEETRRSFAETRELRDRLQKRLGLGLPELSMGMSGDFEMAIEEGSTMVRIGTALFGPRG